MLGHAIALLIGILVGLVLIQFFVCVWNEFNLEMRRDHRFLAEEYINMGQRDLALYHIGKCEKLAKLFIRGVL